tara:strand:+ start:8128 stop:13695 length:5568 start_codon:yes stop_codon:yes gene_type:complete
MTSGKGPSGGPKRFDGGGQSTSYFAARRKQLNRSESSVEPMGIPMVKEMIQNADDRKAQELFLIFTEKSLWITNDGETFNHNESQDDEGNRVSGDLANLLGVAQSLAEAEQDRVGRHGTGFELIYCVANRFEIHWWDRTHGDRVSMRSNPEYLESGKSETWDYPWDHSDFDALECPFDTKDRDKKRRGVLFKADWRTKKEADEEYGDHGPIFKNAAFPQWDKSSRRSFFKSCKAYAPFLIQFCKSITNLSVIWLEKGNSEFFRTSRERAYPTSEYTGTTPGELDCEIVEIRYESGSCDNKSASLGFSGVKKEILNLWGNKSGNSANRITLLHGWTSVHGRTSHKNENSEMCLEKTLTSWKYPKYSQFHTHDEHDCVGCPLDIQEGWVPDRTSVVHIHFPLVPINDELGQLEKPGQTLLHSILPLGVVSPNFFMISADLYVNEGRAQLEFQDDKGVWNSCSALTAFWLHSQMMEWICKDGQGITEDSILQALPANPSNWFGALNLSTIGFPNGRELVGEGMRSSLYFDFAREPWLLDTFDNLVAPHNILIPSNENGEYDDEIKVVLEALEMSVMRRKTHAHVLSPGSYVLDELQHLLRKSGIYDPGLSSEMRKEILAKVKSSNLDDLSIDSKLALARMVNHLDSDFTGAVYPDANGRLRNRAEFSTIPNGLSVLQELQGERPSLHPIIEDIFEPGETSVQDALRIIQSMQESNPEKFENLGDDDEFVDVIMRMADQILSDPGITDLDRIMYDFIPCKIGNRVFVRAYQHLVECPHCRCNNPPILDNKIECLECEEILYRDDLDQRIPLPTGRPEDWSRMHIMSPEEQDIPAVVAERIVTACSSVHFSDRLATGDSKVGLMRYLGKKGKSTKSPKQYSLFQEETLNDWLGVEEDSEPVSVDCRMAFLDELKEYAKTGGHTNLRGLFNDSPIFYDSDRNWAPASEFVLYIDEVTLDMLQGGEGVVRTPHPELLDENQVENDWMTLSELGGAKKNVEFEHLEAAIRGLLGENLDSYGESPEKKYKSLASIMIHLLRHQELLEKKTEEFDNLEWIPIGLQDGFESESDMYCKWSDFPLPGRNFYSVWGQESLNPHIRFRGEPVSPHQYLAQTDIEWLKEKTKSEPNWINEVGMSHMPNAERMFMAVVSDSENSNEPISDELYSHLRNLQSIPSTYNSQEYRFFHPVTQKWHENVGKRTLLVEGDIDAEIIEGNCIQKDGLSDDTIVFLNKLLLCKLTTNPEGSAEVISRISTAWAEEDYTSQQIPDILKILAKAWKEYHEEGIENVQLRCLREGIPPIFPIFAQNNIVKVNELVIVESDSHMAEFIGRAEVYTIDKLARQEEQLDCRRSKLSASFSINDATLWSEVEKDYSRENSDKISQLLDLLNLNDPETQVSDLEAWVSAMFDIEWWHSEENFYTNVPIPFYENGELVVDFANTSTVYLGSRQSQHADKLDDFINNGLSLVIFSENNHKHVIEMEGWTKEEGPFPEFDFNLVQDNLGLRQSDKDAFPELEFYIADLNTAIHHNFKELQDENIFEFLSSLVKCFRTQKSLQIQWKVGDTEISKGTKPWTVETLRSEPPIWPEIQVTYNTNRITEYDRTRIVKEILRKGIALRLDADTEGRIAARKLVATALEREGEEVRSADIIELISPLLEFANPRDWIEVDGYEELWGGDVQPKLASELVLNPDVATARSTVLNWYKDAGCQICGALTPAGPGLTSYEETRSQIFKRVASRYIWQSATERGGDVGNWLYLCPTHHKLHTKKCIKIGVLHEDDEIEIEDLVDRARENENILNEINSNRVFFNVYERRGTETPWEEEQTGANWSGFSEFKQDNNRMTSAHGKKIIAKIKSFVRSNLNS